MGHAREVVHQEFSHSQQPTEDLYARRQQYRASDTNVQVGVAQATMRATRIVVVHAPMPVRRVATYDGLEAIVRKPAGRENT